jgi:hypothetical protein
MTPGSVFAEEFAFTKRGTTFADEGGPRLRCG